MNPVAEKLYEKATTCNNHTVSLTLRAVADAIVEVEKETNEAKQSRSSYHAESIRAQIEV